MLALLLAAAITQVTWRPAISATLPTPAEAEGTPARVAGPDGPALRFDGASSLLVGARPVTGWAAWTIEAVIRPEGGPFEQRFLHLSETDPVTGADAAPSGRADANNRVMFEVRVLRDGWYIDTYLKSAAGQKALVDPTRLHPLGRWYAVAQSYDGATYRAYVDGVLQAEAPVAFAPLGPGRARLGARMNRIDYFHGSIALVRFTDYALAPAQLIRTGSAG